ncbi:DNRLRE domain-containing protein [Fulvivirga sp. M361]|uniref:CBM96 family carbohydrate-binding protein n=1 Tax=Fulvivirga sp. M361 TaxID=2594266 RepID=UPI001625968C|nr:DNRLRE domain-containing protein [Fulvivirga sp. M361]
MYHRYKKLVKTYVVTFVLLAGGVHGYGQTPTAPTHLSSANITETSVDLTWKAATDDIAVTGYEAVQLGVITSILPQADAFVRGGSDAGKNYGQDELLTVKKDGNLSFIRRTYLKFDISTLPVSFGKAILRLHVIGSGVNKHDMRLVPDNSWTENGIKWNNQPSANAPVIASWITPGVGNMVDIDLTDLVKTEMAEDKLFSLQIRSQGNRFISYVSKESGNTSLRPNLILFNESATLGTTPGDTTLTVANLTPGQTYDVAVKAMDGDGNRSELSNLVSVTTLIPVEEPSAPTNLTVTSVTETTADLVWNASTDNVAVTGYEAVRLSAVDSLLPQADAFVKGGNDANKNFGQDAKLTVKKDNNQNLTRRTYMKFNLSNISTPVDKAILRLHVLGSGVDTHDMRLVPSNSWTENGIKWNNQPSTNGEVIASWITPGIGNIVFVDLTELVRNEMTEDKLFSVQIQSRGSRFISYVSKESSSIDMRPYLMLLEATGLNTTPAADTTLTIANLEPGQVYNDIGVRALDGDGNKSDISNIVRFITTPDQAPGPLLEAESLVDAASEFPKIFNNTNASGGKVVANNFTSTFIDFPDIYGFDDGAFVLRVGYRNTEDQRKTLVVNGDKQFITLPNSNNQFAATQFFLQLDPDLFNSLKLLTDDGDTQGGDYDFFVLEKGSDEIPNTPMVDDVNDSFGWNFAGNYQDTTLYEYSLDRGSSWQDVTSNPQPVGDMIYAVGQVQVRVKSDPLTGRPAGFPLLSDKAYSIDVSSLSVVPGSLIWRLGKDDQTASEFNPDYGAAVSSDSLLVPEDWATRNDWSVLRKGLKLDQNGTLVVNYSLSQVPEHGVELRLRILDAHRVIPQLNVFSNETLAGLIQIAGLEGSNVDLKFKETYRLYIPKEFLQEGENVLRLSLDNGLFATDQGDRFHRFVWDYLALEALGAPANEPIHGRYVTIGNDFRAKSEAIKARTAFLLAKWCGITYSGNWMRVGITIEESGLEEDRRAYLEALKQMNFNVMPLLFTTNFINKQAGQGVVTTSGRKQFEKYLSNFSDLLTAIEISNEPGLFNTPQSGNLALTQLAAELLPTYGPHLKIVAPGWAYWPTNGTPNGWARSPEQRRPIELLSDYTNGHSYTTSGTQGIGGSLAETLRVYDSYNGDAFPKPMVMSETGGNDNAADNDAYGTSENRFAAVFDREMRGNIGYVDDIIYHADYSPGSFALFNYPGDINKFNPLNAIAHPNNNEPQNPRLKTYRRLALAYATHGSPLSFEYINREELAGKKGYFRAVNTAALGRLTTGAQSDKVLLNFTNFGNEILTMSVKVVMPQGAQYVGDRFGAGRTYETSHTRVDYSTDGDNSIVLTETIGPGESVQYILNVNESQPPTAPSQLMALTKDFKRIDLDWEPSTDNVSVSGYNIYRDDALLNVVPSSVTFFADLSVDENTTYVYEVEAFDDAGNHSVLSNQAIATSDTIPTTPGGPKYEAEDCIPPGADFPVVENDATASGGKKVFRNFFQTKCKIFGVVAQQENYIITMRYKSRNKDAARDFRINEELNIAKFNTSVSLPKTGNVFKDVQQQIKLVPGEKNIITIYTRFGQDQEVEYDYFIVEPGTLPAPVPEWKTVNHDNAVILYSSNFQQDGTLHTASSSGESATFTFEGTGIRWYSNVVADYGEAAIVIDDVAVDTVDIPSAAFEGPDKLVFEEVGLEDKLHTIKIVSLSSATITVTKLQYLGIKDILVPPGPDVIVEDITTEPANARGGDAVRFVAKVKNIGTLPTPAGVITGVSFRVNGGVVGFSDNFNSVIQPGETVNITQVSAPWISQANEVVELLAFVDDINRYGQSGVNEQSRSNNRFRKAAFFSSPGTVYEAEDALLSDVTAENTTTGFSGNGYAAYSSQGGFVEWNIDVADSADYEVAFRYNNSSGGPVVTQLLLNGLVVAADFTFGPTGTSEWLIKDIPLVLNKGVNTIRVTSDTVSNLQLDFLRPSTAVSEAVTITQPGTGSIFNEGEDITVEIAVSRPDVTRVVLLLNGETLSALSSAPYVFTWSGATAGTYTLAAQAVTASGFVLQSEVVPVTIAAGDPDLVITDILWEQNYVVVNDSIRFKAVVANQGVSKSPDATILSVRFKVEQEVVTWSNVFSGILLPGESVQIEATSGIQGTPFWQAMTSGQIRVDALADEENRIFESDENNNAFSETLFVFDSLPDVAPLNLTSMCSQDPSIDRRWRVRNPNNFSIPVTWEVYGTSQNGVVEALPGDVFFTTATVGGANTTKIYWYDASGQLRSKVKASGGATCHANARIASDTDSTDVFEKTGHIYPNPASNSFSMTYVAALAGEVRIAITDLKSRVVKEQVWQVEKGNVTLEIDIKDLKSGMYLFNLSQGAHRCIQKLLIDK